MKQEACQLLSAFLLPLHGNCIPQEEVSYHLRGFCFLQKGITFTGNFPIHLRL
jgi:hypothetical protein